MKLEIDNQGLRSVYAKEADSGWFPEAVADRFRFAVGFIAAMRDEGDFKVMPGWRVEKLEGQPAPRYSLRLDKQWCLILEIRGDGADKRIGVVEIVASH